MNPTLEIAFILTWLFGALVFWPMMRFALNYPPQLLVGFKLQFFIQLIGLVVGFCLVYYYWASGNRDWLHAWIFPYSAGLLGWIAAIVAFCALAAKRREKGNATTG